MDRVFSYHTVVIVPDRKDPRVCDYCNRVLIAPDGIVVEDAYLTDHGMMCRLCRRRMKYFCMYRPGMDVSGLWWYRGDFS